MDRGAWYAPMPTGPEYVPPKGSTEYTIPHLWGDLAVSRAAHKQLGLIPLTANVREGYDPQPETPVTDPLLRVYLMTADELGLPEESRKSYLGWIERAHPKGIDVKLAVGGTPTDFAEDMMRNFAETTGTEEEEDLHVAVIGDTEWGVPLDEQLSQRAPEVLVGLIGDTIMVNLPDNLKNWYRGEASRRRYNEARNFGLIAASGVAVVTTLGLALNNVVIEAVVPFYVAAVARAFVKDYRQGLQRANRYEKALGLTASRASRMVAVDISKVYGRTHFERQFPEPPASD